MYRAFPGEGLEKDPPVSNSKPKPGPRRPQLDYIPMLFCYPVVDGS